MTARSPSRRKFLKAAGLTLGAAALTCSGASYLAERAAENPRPKVETPGFVFGKENEMQKRLLVAYATRTGSTVGVAAALGETLGGRGFAVDVKPIQENPALDGCYAVVIGSAVNGARWLPEAVEFVRNNQSALNQVPVALFCVHIMNLGADDKSRRNRKAYLDAVRPLLQPLDEAFFAGQGMGASQSGFGRWLAQLFKIPDGDCRDWNAIRAWGARLNPLPAA